MIAWCRAKRIPPRPRPFAEQFRRVSGSSVIGLKQNERPDFRPAFAVIRFIRLHQGAQKGSATNFGGRCPSRAASKTPMPTLNGQRNHPNHKFRRTSRHKGSKKTIFFEIIFTAYFLPEIFK
jgi:hypothetical protein